MDAKELFELFIPILFEISFRVAFVLHESRRHLFIIPLSPHPPSLTP